MPTQRGSTQAGGGFHLVTRLEGRSRKVSRDWMKGFTRQPRHQQVRKEGSDRS